MKKLQSNGLVKTPESWDELTEIISGSTEAIFAAFMGWNLACKYHDQILAEMKEKEDASIQNTPPAES